MVAPLTVSLKKDSFSWNDEATQAFEALRQAMVTLPMLTLADFSLSFIIETDATRYGIWTVLSQKGCLIAYFSRALSSRARMKSIYERELMVVVLSVQK